MVIIKENSAGNKNIYMANMHPEVTILMQIDTKLISNQSWELKVETEAFIMVAQYQNHQTSIKNGSNPICRLCKQYVETIDHLVSVCPILTQ